MRETQFPDSEAFVPGNAQSINKQCKFSSKRSLCSGNTRLSLSKANDDYEDQERIQLRCFFRAEIGIRLIDQTHASEIVHHGPQEALAIPQLQSEGENWGVQLVLTSAGVHIYDICSQLPIGPTGYTDSGGVCLSFGS